MSDSAERLRLAAIGKKRCFNCNHFTADPAHVGDWVGYCEIFNKAWALGEIEFARTCDQWESTETAEKDNHE